MSKRLDSEKQKNLEPIRMQYAIKEISALGFEVTKENDTEISFEFNSSKIKFFPFSGWHTGKSINDGRGIYKLLKQLKNGT
ncbi:hypothetical protein N6B72_04905 [Chryseobacterium soli]|uniref:hypothetical protein n=1 Tax=Chryseobacterium soli TaxID=445961 RepID=UPI0029557D56|nr:hypothetical protein [Chryseobacterium soli]MDV7696257.1 hypothetical protein [Chryseobacterium soli]